MAKDKVLFFCAHPDDESFGAGGTIAKYIKDGKQVMVVTFSYGEASHAWLKKRVTRDIRKKELANAMKLMGYQKHTNLGLTEGKFLEDAEQKNIKEEIIKIINKFKPSKIFTHTSGDRDPNGDHCTVNKIVMNALEKIEYGGDVYGFGVWNLFSFKKMDYPQLFVDITDTFGIKLEALKQYSSQWSSMSLLIWGVYVRAIGNGLTHGVRYAERFYKIK
ncbi:hypothetical protein A3K72_03155 [Candidatus Woesearchaeota archaeon RBG_13_36_6]|nr:MAG: hypothetical protein A3K72_03155 [Candidatus Woesearchaeota archaeon RBG_13_36_6]